VYVVVSAKCILEYILNTPPENLFEYNYNLNYPVCVKFLWEYTDFPSSYILTPNSFTAIMTLSLGFNIVWMRISARIKRCKTLNIEGFSVQILSFRWDQRRLNEAFVKLGDNRVCYLWYRFALVYINSKRLRPKLQQKC
jgi:hypothetical protein